MMLSVMVVGAGAAFSDQSKIKNTEAVDACTALNIIGGYPDGSFKPEGNITRAEVTKMICVALNGGKEPNLATNATPTFSDVRTNANSAWAEKYIESCASQGIVSGVGGGKFAPAGNVTGTQLAKMLLVSLGYKSENEGFTGNAWATNVNTIASAKGLYEGLETLDVSAALTRDSAARMIWNALQAYEVEYKTSLVADKDGKLSTQITVQDKVVGSNNDKITLLRDKYDAWVNVGTLTNVKSNVITLTMNDADKATSDLVTKNGSIDFSKVDKDYSALIGQKIKVLFKNGKTNDVIGVYATSDNNIYKTQMNNVELDGQKIKFDGTSYSVDNTKKIALTFIGVDETKTETVGIEYFDQDGTLNADKSNGVTSLSEVTFVDTDDNNKIDTALVIEKVAAEVTNVASDKITFHGKTYKYADEQIDKNIAQDDWAVMSANLYKDCKTIVKADVVTAVADGQKDKTSKSQVVTGENDNGNYVQYKIDGTWYNVSKTVKDDASISTGDTVKAYVVNGVAVKIKTDDGNLGIPSNIAVAVGVGGDGSLNGDQVRVRYFDGTLKTLTMSDKSVTPLQGVAYKITGSDDNAKLEMLTNQKEYNSYKSVLGTYDKDATTAVSKAATATQDTITTITKDGSEEAVKVDDKATIILYTSAGRSKVITGKQYNSLTTDYTATVAFTKKSNGLNRVQMAAVQVSNINVSGHSSDKYAYIVSTGYENNGDVYYTIWDGAKNIDVTEENTTSSERTQGTLIGYSDIDSKNKISDVTVYGNIGDTMKDTATSTTASPNGVVGEIVKAPATAALNTNSTYIGGNESTDAKYITVNNRKFKITADTVVLRVDSDADEDADIGQAYTYGTTTMTKAQKKSSNPDVYTENVMFVMNEAVAENADNKEIAVLVIDSTGAFKGHKIADSTPSTPSTPSSGTYAPNADTTVNVADSDVVTGAAATYNSKDGKMTVQLTVKGAYTQVTSDNIKVTVNSVDTKATIGSLTNGKLQLTVSCGKGDKVVVNVGNGAFN